MYLTVTLQLPYSYLLVVRDHKLRRWLSKIRLSSHDLCIEKGRHTKPKTKIEDRLCIYCDMTSVEDEFHFIMECKLYDNERSALFNNITNIISLNGADEDVFIRLMSCKDEHILFKICKFLSKCFKIHTSCV